MRSRGASSFHLVAMAVIEATVLAVPAAAIAPFLAVDVVALLGAVGPTAGLGLTDSASIGESAVVVSARAGSSGRIRASVTRASASCWGWSAWATA